MQVDKAEQDKQSAIIKAQGEATSARLIGEAIQENPAFITLRKIEAARDIAGTISGAANKVFLSSDSLLLNLVSLMSIQTTQTGLFHDSKCLGVPTAQLCVIPHCWMCLLSAQLRCDKAFTVRAG